MNNREQTLALIETIGANPREWGRHIDALFALLDTLSGDDWCAVKRSASPKDRYAVMIQYLGHIERTYTANAPEAARTVEGGVALILLEGFELDYRETTLRVKDFVKTTGATVSQFTRRARECDVPALEYTRGLCQTYGIGR
ncbi:hypothetical protein [Sphingomonas sp. OK281]|uniref:hypothetical protein n=1 Tax=Sphingomonas sp. OK281 TaxID=1881067 RepID=UPI0008ECFEC4|nr:hypothetical protein [Sphingomonas sp. OK281]SFN86696.1 hypothetical protein SAMN05428984_1205 [Sphingomonas sp. OK281]